MKYDKEKNDCFSKPVWHSEKFQYIKLIEVALFLLHNRILILFWNASHLYFQMGSFHSSSDSPEVGTQPKFAKPNDQEGLFVSLPLWLDINESTFSPCIGNSATMQEICLGIKPTLGEAKQRGWYHCAQYCIVPWSHLT